MMHVRRRRVIGGTITALAAALVPTAASWPVESSSPQDPGAWLIPVVGIVLQVAAAVAALAVAGAAVWWSLPHARQAVRTARAWHLRHRARCRDRASRSTSGQSPAPGARPTLKRAAFVIVLVMAAIVSGVAAVALALNFEHGRQLSELNGEHGWRAAVWPLAVDGLLLASSLVGLVRRLLGLSVGFRSRAAFVVGIAASAGANIVLALHSNLTSWALTERIGVTTWPTIALLLSHEMGLQLIAYYARITDVFGVEAPAPELVAERQARENAERLLAKTRSDFDRQLAALREQAEKALQDAQAETVAAQRQAEDQLAELRAQHQQHDSERQQLINALRAEVEAAEQRAAERHQQVEDLQRQLDEFDELGDQDADFDAIREHLGWAIEGALRDGRAVRNVEVPQIYRVSLRWAQKYVPTLISEVQQQRLAEPAPPQLVLAAR